MSKIFVILGLLIILSSCDASTQPNTSKFEINDSINKEVEINTSKSEFESSSNDAFEIYNNVIIADFYENDSLIMSTKMEKRELPFKSFFYNHNDTISIDGAYGIFGGIGFSIKIIEGKPIVYHMVAGDDTPTYSMTNKGKLEFRIEVPCTETNLILSRVPKVKDEETIYGLVEFKSNEYYGSGPTINGKEIEERKKVRMDMKIYFKSKYLNIAKMK